MVEAPSFQTYLAQVIHPSDRRAWKLNYANAKELDHLIKNKTWKIVCREETSPNWNISNGRFVLAIKDEGTNKEIWKA